MFDSIIPIVVCCSLTAANAGADEVDGLPLIFADDFQQGADHWEPTDPKAWRIIEVEGRGKVYDQYRQSNYRPPHRSPSNLSLLRDIVVGDFVLLI